MALPPKVLGREVMPAETGDLTGPASEAGPHRGVVRDAAAESVANKGLDSVSFCETGRCG